jgi:glycosyltransferase involved in cell wall biosynthesis
MRSTPKVSVLIPTYNSAPFLDEAIQSVLNQSYPDFELIIVDNKSTDNTSEVIEKYLGDKRVSYYINQTNIGLVNNFNKCLTYAKGDYIKFLCSDDKFHPDLLSKFVQVLDAYPNVVLVTSNKEGFGTKSFTERPPVQYLQPGKKVISQSIQDCNWIGEPTTVMFRRKNLQVGNFNNEYKYFPDWDMWLRQLTLGDCYIIPETLSYFRLHPNQVTAINYQNLTNYFEEYQFYKNIKHKNEYNIDFSQVNIDKLIKEKALACAKVIIKVIPRLKKRSNWFLLNQAVNIAFSEGVILRLLSGVFSKRELAKVYKLAFAR